jgi:proprotein convertase subtilisin/kexin type 5
MLAGVCSSACPSTHYASLALKECLPCHLDCLTCNGSSSTSCLLCFDVSKILINGFCYASCPNSTYSAFCLPCHSTCLSCTGGTSQ